MTVFQCEAHLPEKVKATLMAYTNPEQFQVPVTMQAHTHMSDSMQTQAADPKVNGIIPILYVYLLQRLDFTPPCSLHMW